MINEKVPFNRRQLRHRLQEQTDLQEMSLPEMHRGGHGLEVGPHQRREEGQVQKLLQEEGRAGDAGPGTAAG